MLYNFYVYKKSILLGLWTVSEEIMNAKQIKHYEILSELFTSDMLKAATVDKCFGAVLKLDYG